MKKYLFVCIILFCILCTGCGFELRSKNLFPTELDHLYYTSDKPYSTLSTQLIILFQSLGVHLQKNEKNTRFSVIISNDIFSYGRPEVVNASLPTNINFSQTATITIRDNLKNKIIASQSFTTNQSLTLNANQIYTSNANNMIKQELNREMVSIIYYWVISSNLRDNLHHAITDQTTQLTS